jgi:hypothetical protein
MIRWLAILSPLIVATSAYAHDWYPWECCGGFDCAPVDHVKGRSPNMIVTSKHGSVAVPATFPRRDSKDNRMHVCMRRESSGMKLICLFIPPTM